MSKAHITACVIPSNDPHMSEYVADHWKARNYFSGFTGSAGTLVVTDKKACLFTDSRYILQAEKQLKKSNIDLFIAGDNVPSYSEWLISNLQNGAVVSMHEFLFSIDEIKSITHAFEKNRITLNTKIDVISSIWTDRPSLPEEKIFIHDDIYSGKTIQQKLEIVSTKLKNKHADILLLNKLDEIAWLLNIRGNDISYNPLAIAYVAIEDKKVTLFISNKKITPKTKQYLTENKIFLKDYTAFNNYLSTLKNKTILLDNTNMNFAVYNQVKKSNNIIFDASPISLLKSIKNNIEIDGFKEAMIKDGIALTQFFIWLENCLKEKVEITEISLAEKLKAFRSQQALFHGESFAPIVAFNEHGAIVHYTATTESNVKIEPTGLLLIDSGAQYLNGTTDITRTIALGELDALQKRNFTLVLKGHIALARAIFSNGTTGNQLDSKAREALQTYGLNYGHGTGHGVGHFLCVHEGPQSIKPDHNNTVLEKGMIISNEPGVYFANEYGIRIENLLLIQDNENSSSSGLLSFETLTLFPIDTNAIDFSLLDKNEIEWLSDYHKMIYKKLSPFLSTTENKWLANKCLINT